MALAIHLEDVAVMGQPVQQSRRQTLADRFCGHKAESYLRFLMPAAIKPTNNHAEQTIRHLAIDRRITQWTPASSPRTTLGGQVCLRVYRRQRNGFPLPLRFVDLGAIVVSPRPCGFVNNRPEYLGNVVLSLGYLNGPEPICLDPRRIPPFQHGQLRCELLNVLQILVQVIPRSLERFQCGDAEGDADTVHLLQFIVIVWKVNMLR